MSNLKGLAEVRKQLEEQMDSEQRKELLRRAGRNLTDLQVPVMLDGVAMASIIEGLEDEC